MPRDGDSVEIAGIPREDPSPGSDARAGRKFLRIYFACANQYTRAYCNAAGTQYTARCAACGVTKKFVVGEGGTSERFFALSCR